MQHVGETARRHLQAERGPRCRCATFASGTPSSVCSSTTSATTPGPSCTPAAPSASEVPLQNVAAAAPAADTASSGRPRCRSAEPPGARRAVLPDTATPRASPRPRRRSPDTPQVPPPRSDVDLGRARTARLPPVGRAGPPAGMPAAPLGSVLGEGGRLPESGSACGRQLLLEVIGLSLQAVVLTPQAFVAALQAFVLVSQARVVALAVRPLSAPPFLLRAWLPCPDRHSQRARRAHTELCHKL